jgi:hypothetical protein
MNQPAQTPCTTASKPLRRNWVVIPPSGTEQWIIRDTASGVERRFSTQREALRFALFEAADPMHASVATAGE